MKVELTEPSGNLDLTHQSQDYRQDPHEGLTSPLAQSVIQAKFLPPTPTPPILTAVAKSGPESDGVVYHKGEEIKTHKTVLVFHFLLRLHSAWLRT